jgi:hypothetical protein
MANRYWVGGTGTWVAGSTTNWSASTGGASGASVPTAADSVFFDQAGTYTVTLTGALTCLDFTVSAGTVTFSSTGTPTINGSMSLIVGTLWSASGTITFVGATAGKTITTNGTAFNCAWTFNAVGGVWTLGSALNIGTASNLTVTAGTFSTSAVGNYALTCSSIQSSNLNTRRIDLNASTVTLTSAVNIMNPGTFGSGLTFNTGTSQIIAPTAATSMSGNGYTFYNVAFTATAPSTISIGGANTFNNLAITASASTSNLAKVSFNANNTINGTLSTVGTSGNRRVVFQSATLNIAYTLTVNSIPSLTDADFRDLIVQGTAAPIGGTRIGNCGNCSGITFSAAKTVYMVTSGSALTWTDNIWSSTASGTASTDFFPLPQDTAAFTNFPALVGISTNATTPHLPTVDFSARTLSSSLALVTVGTIYGSFIGASTLTTVGSTTLSFQSDATQTIICNGATIVFPIAVDMCGGTLNLGDAFVGGFSCSIAVINGTFNTAGYAVTASTLSSNNSNVRTINLGASTVSIVAAGVAFGTATNLTFNAGTSTIIFSAIGAGISAGKNLIFYNVFFTFTNSATYNISVTGAGELVFNNLSFGAPTGTGLIACNFGANQTINGTLTCAGASAVRRVSLRSGTLNTQRTLTVNGISATDCDFRDIVIAGAAAGSSLTRAGDLGNNSGITFPAAKTVYWNLAGAQNWSATAWATSSGGAPDINNFPLAQDTAVFNNAGAADTITTDAIFPIGTFDASARTTAMSIVHSATTSVYGDWKFGTGVTHTSGTFALSFAKFATQTITSNGVTFNTPVVTVNGTNTYLQLADAITLSSIRALSIPDGTFDAAGYNVTIGQFSTSSSSIKMGSGTWTLTGTGAVWSSSSSSVSGGDATIVLSDTSTAARTFSTLSILIKKIIIGGTTGTSTLTFPSGNNVIEELASTKTVAHTIDFGTNTPTFGKWSVTGSAGNVVTIAGTGLSFIAGPAVTGIDYLAMGTWGISTTSQGEFYAGANSTGTAAAPVFRTAAPAPRNLYWVGGTGNWSSTTKWSTTSGGSSGAAIPTSLDSVTFNSASNATAYTATIDVTMARCAALSIAGPASGIVTIAGTTPLSVHGNVLYAATGVAQTFTGALTLSGNLSYTFTSNGRNFSSVTLNGFGATWTLGSALTITGNLTCNRGTLNTSASNYAVNSTSLVINSSAAKTAFNLNASTVTLSGITPIDIFPYDGITFNAGTSLIVLSSTTTATIYAPNRTFYNVNFNQGATTSIAFTGGLPNTFNNLTFTGPATLGLKPITFDSNQTISGTLTLSAGTAAAYRTSVASNTLGIPRTLSVGTLAAGATDIDFRDITVTGAAAPLTGTRFGNCGGNSGITFPAAKTVYYRQTGSNNWGTASPGSWSLTSGGALDATAFPLAQDTAVFPAATYPATASVTTINANYNIGTIDMSLRTANTMTLATGVTTPAIHGNWVNGTGITLSGTGQMTFTGRGSQTITSAGRTFTQNIAINTPGGSVTLQDNFTTTDATANAISHTSGTFNAATYNVTVAGGVNFAGGSDVRTMAVGSGTWTIAGISPWAASTATNLTVTGTGTLRLTSASTKTFAGGSLLYSGITLDQGGAGQLTVSGNNTFGNITNTYGATGATTISFGATTQSVVAFSASGTAGNLLTITGTSAASPATLIYTGSANVSCNYIVPTFLRVFPPAIVSSTWYAGFNSTNGGTFGWLFSTAPTIYSVFISESASGVDAVLSRVTFLSSVTETASGADTVSGVSNVTYASSVAETSSGVDAVSSRAVFGSSVIESASGTDAVSALAALQSAVAESASGIDVTSALASLGSAIAETASGLDSQTATNSFARSVAETATAIDATASGAVFKPLISETASGIDTVSHLVSFGVAVAEASSGVDAASALATFQGSVVESASGIDVTSASPLFSSSTSETASAVDTTASTFLFFGSIAETASGIDATSSVPVYPRAVSETASGIDVASSLVAFGSAVNEASSGVDTTSGSPAYPRTITEAASGIDATVGSITFPSSISEAASGIDIAAGLAILLSSASEAASGIDAASTRTTFGGTVAEASSGIDTTSSVPVYPRSVAEAASGVDATVGFITFPSSITETASGIDTDFGIAGATRNISEAASGIDVISGNPVFLSTVTETSSGVETVSAIELFGSTISEAASGIDTVSSLRTLPGTITETASGVDSSFSRVVLVSSASETASGVDAVSGSAVYPSSVTETASGIDAVSTRTIVGSAVVEAVSGIDAISSLVTFGGRVNEAGSGVETAASRVVFPSFVTEAASGVDSVFGQSVFPSTVSEASSGIDAIVGANQVGTAVSESASGIDVTAIQTVFGGIVTEAASVTDVVDAQQIINVALAEFVSGLDDFSPAGSTFNAAIAENVGAADLFSARYLWELINDTQAVNWDNINTAQTVTWAAVNNAQTTNWGVVSNPQTPGWGTIDDNAPTTWQNINT